MGETVADFERCSLELERPLLDGCNERKSFDIFAAKSCTVPYINDLRYTDDDRDKTMKGKEEAQRKANVNLIDACRGNLTRDFYDSHVWG